MSNNIGALPYEAFAAREGDHPVLGVGVILSGGRHGKKRREYSQNCLMHFGYIV